jgi:hypothetical protein
MRAKPRAIIGVIEANPRLVDITRILKSTRRGARYLLFDVLRKRVKNLTFFCHTR